MTVRQIQVTFDCADPKRVALFWCEALGYVVPPPPPGFADWDAFEATLPAEAHGSAFAFGDSTPIGETERLARERAAYEAASHGSDLNRGHALGGSAGTTEGQ